MSPQMKKALASWIVLHPDLTMKQMAAELDISLSLVYRIIDEYLDTRTVYTLKASTEAQESD